MHAAHYRIAPVILAFALSSCAAETDDVSSRLAGLDPLSNVIEIPVAPAGDTFVDSYPGQWQDANYDSAPRLYADGYFRTLVHWDEEAIRTALDDRLLVRASLRFTVDKLSGDGGLFRAHWMQTGWQNGKVTYACPNDLLAGNGIVQCDTPWEIDASNPNDRPYVAAASDSIELPDEPLYGEQLELDVTADLLAALSGSGEPGVDRLSRRRLAEHLLHR